ncbi:hypothetical protein N9N28_17180 [Rubripirellula amarantea]|uniref:Uncharacterized protein n=2 Tax=Rubripirellula amarantea TaxID=2527999 RepID=A0A5C5WU18_9BACT|nr:hypothetical protein [Rubripirellula amarantea]TWT53352.1 hypothetical protein Pla22_09810 [Rubripirellula amarantea]
MPEKSSFSDLAMTELGGLGAETGFEEDELGEPLRFSGYVSAVLGIFSAVSLVGIGGVAVAVLAIAFGAFALRPAASKVSGILPAKFGILLGVAFGICGVLLPVLKTRTLGNQAEYFARQFMNLVMEDQKEIVMELHKSYNNRFAPTMPLRDYYVEGDDDRQVEFYENNEAMNLIKSYGPDAQWVLDRPVRVYHQFGTDKAEIVFKNQEDGKQLQFFMHYLVDSNDQGQWHVNLVQPYRELIIAESSN